MNCTVVVVAPVLEAQVRVLTPVVVPVVVDGAVVLSVMIQWMTSGCKNTRWGNFTQDTEEEEVRRRGETGDGVRGHERDTLFHV